MLCLLLRTRMARPCQTMPQHPCSGNQEAVAQLLPGTAASYPPSPSPESRCPEDGFASTVAACHPVIHSGAWFPSTLSHGSGAACSGEASSSEVEPSSACGRRAPNQRRPTGLIGEAAGLRISGPNRTHHPIISLGDA
jgi:hypothetical protein